MRILKLGSLSILALMFAPAAVVAQTRSADEAQSKTRAIAASFTKFKSVSKEKRGIKKEKYLRVVTEPVQKSNPADYSGFYEMAGMDFGLELSVDRNGVVTGSGYEPLAGSVKRTFSVRDGRIDGALLRATKVYGGGETEKFEGAFMNRTSFNSPTDKGHTVFGLGTVGKPIEVSGLTLDKVFYDKVR
ncbi:MAG: hypothetical protein ACJ78I_04290 [Gemmatimonadaceae bacterium]